MFGHPSRAAVLRNVEKALKASQLKYEVKEDGSIFLGAMGDDLPINMGITADDTNLTLNIYCFLMFEIPDSFRDQMINELNTVNNTINNGSFFMTDEESRICFKIVQSYYDHIPSPKLIQNLIMIAFRTVDVNDGKLKNLIPAGILKKDVMYN
ncbi:MAG: YbjN domain-containing protein [Candidatus Methanomethylophilaceae archaeon]|nr:YbjN domain-containing protein [Candidatus Methanomethylophilaceae archaeon]